MRTFSERERKIITKIVEGAKGHLTYVAINAYNGIFYAEKVEFDSAIPHQLSFYTTSVNNISTDKIFSVQKEIVDTSYLLKYLENEGLIAFIPSNSVNRITQIGNFDKKNLIQVSNPIDPVTSSVLKRSMNECIYVSFELEKLVSYGFKTEDRIHFEIQLNEAKKATKISQWSFCIAFLALIASLIIPVYTAKEIPSTLIETQYNGIIEEMKSHGNSSVSNKMEILTDSVSTNNKKQI